jgi:hypothetical protein
MRAEHTFLSCSLQRSAFHLLCALQLLIDVTADIVCSHPVCIHVMRKRNVASEHFEGEVNYVKKFVSKVLANCDS